MKHLLKLFLLLFTLSCVFTTAFAQDKKSAPMIKTKAKIININRAGSRKRKKFIATVQFKTNKGLSIKTRIDLLAIPYYGPLSKVGDTIDVYYTKNNPALAYSRLGKFVEDYGLMILIILGVIFSGWRLFKIYTKPKEA